MNTGLSLACETGGQIVKTVRNRRLGVFDFPFEKGEMKLIFKSDIRDLTVYLSYQTIEEKGEKAGLNENFEWE